MLNVWTDAASIFTINLARFFQYVFELCFASKVQTTTQIAQTHQWCILNEGGLESSKRLPENPGGSWRLQTTKNAAHLG